jgi:hypothetical protein
MSQREQPRSRIGATPAKLALIAVLAIALVVVVASNWPQASATLPSAAEAETQQTTTTPATPGTPEAPPSVPASPFGAFAEDKDWPAVPLKDVTKFDPFATAAWAIPPEVEQQERQYNEDQIKELLHAENAIIFVAGDQRVARIGSKEFRVGDVIGHFKITDISSRGVVLSEAE